MCSAKVARPCSNLFVCVRVCIMYIYFCIDCMCLKFMYVMRFDVSVNFLFTHKKIAENVHVKRKK